MTDKVLPVQQLTVLAICRFAEPLSLLSILPYLPEMIESFGVPENDIALWASAAASLYSACECIAAIPWSILSDHLGRRPVILLSLTITMATSLLWGFSTNLTMALTARILAGLGNGVAGIIRTMVAELCPWKELQPVAFSVMPIVWNLGSIIGPAFGGALSNPYRRVPGTPAGPYFFEKFPYALPNLASSGFFIVGIIIGIFYLKETLPSRKGNKDFGLRMGERIATDTEKIMRKFGCCSARGSDEETKPLHGGSSSPLLEPSCQADAENAVRGDTGANEADKSLPTWRDVLSKQSCLNLLAYGLLCMHSLSYDQILPVFMHHPVQDPSSAEISLPFKFSGGFGIDTSRISIIFTLYGIATMFFQFFIFPPCVRRFGTLHCFKIVSTIFPITYFITPFASLLPGAFSKEAALLSIWFVKGLCSNIGFPSSTILLMNSVGNPRYLARLNGVAVVVSSVGRALGPSVMGPLFTLGVDRGYVIVPFWTLGLITALGIIPVFGLRDPDEMEKVDDIDEV